MTTHRMSIPVTAWRVAEDGSLPKGVLTTLQDRGTGIRRVRYEREDREVALMREAGWEISTYADYWYWFDCDGNQRARAGDWIVSHEYGIERMGDEQFRARCTEVGDDAS